MIEIVKAKEPPARHPADIPAELTRLTIEPSDPLETLKLDEHHLVDAKLAGCRIPALLGQLSVVENVSLASAVVSLAKLRDVRFVHCDLSNAIIRGFEARRVEFIDCRLVGLKAIECKWQDVLLRECDARYAQWNDGVFKVSEVNQCHLGEADFRNTDLYGTKFSGVSLQRGDLRGAKLSGCDLRGADLEDITVLAENVRGAIVGAAQAMELAKLLGLVIR